MRVKQARFIVERHWFVWIYNKYIPLLLALLMHSLALCWTPAVFKYFSNVNIYVFFLYVSMPFKIDLFMLCVTRRSLKEANQLRSGASKCIFGWELIGVKHQLIFGTGRLEHCSSSKGILHTFTNELSLYLSIHLFFHMTNIAHDL